MTMPKARRHSTEEMLRCELAHVRGAAARGPDVYEDARKLELTALCLSGGGIRSASFCLGVLQALAKKKLLRKFDYLSTVSGGGYIGGWLQQLIREKSKHDRAPTVEGRVAYAEEELAKPAPYALRQLRDHTNFLTPQAGIGSADTWAGIALYLRNLMLNWMVLLPVFLLITLLPIFHRTAIWWLGQFSAVAWCALVLAHVALAYAVCMACRWLPSHYVPKRVDTTAQARARRNVVVGVLLWAALLPFALQYQLYWGWSDPWLGGNGTQGIAIVVGSFAGALLFGYLGAFMNARKDPARHLYRENACQWSLASLGAALLMGIVLSVLLAKRSWLRQQDIVADTLTILAPIALLLVLLAQTTFYIGIRDHATRPEQDREWLARLNGIILGCGMAWTLFATACLFGPKRIIDHALAVPVPVPDTAYSLLTGIGAVLAGSSVALLGRQATSPVRGAQEQGDKPQWLRDLALRILPVLFILALFGVLGTFLQYGLGRISALWIGPGSAIQCLWEVLAMQLDYDACSESLFPRPPPPGTGWILWMHAGAVAVLFVLLYVFDSFINVNGFSMHAVYRNRLARAFLGTPRGKRQPDPFTGFDFGEDRNSEDHDEQQGDDPRLADLLVASGSGQRLFPVINMAMNITVGQRGAWAERQGAAFTATPLFCGSADLGLAPGDVQNQPGAFVPTRYFAGKRISSDLANRGTHLGSMMTVSGAAASPHMGYHSSPVVAFLMTLFNVRLGAWYPNPAGIGEKIDDDPIQMARPRHSLRALLHELTGQASNATNAIYLSDGGHFENLGMYEMIRRRCKRIVVIDAACDEHCHYFDLGMAIRKAEIDFPVRIELRTPWIAAGADAKKDPARAATLRGIAFGSIAYLDDGGEVIGQGEIIYIKPSWLPDAPKSVLAYAAGNPAFPHEGTEDQWFSESQFESYRALGEHQMSWLLDRIRFVNPEQPTPGELFARTRAILAPLQRA